MKETICRGYWQIFRRFNSIDRICDVKSMIVWRGIFWSRSKKLPIVEPVPFTAYQIRGFEAGVLLGNFKNSEELLFQPCINFFFRINGNTG